MAKGTLFITIGISGSGKTHYSQNQLLIDFPSIGKYVNDNNLSVDDIIVSADNLRKELTGSVNIHTADDYLWMVGFRDRIIEKLNKHDYCLFDATNTRMRVKFLKHFIDYDTIAIIFEPNLELSKLRIENDLINKVDRSNVPCESIEFQHQTFRQSIIYYKWDGKWDDKIKEKIKPRLMKVEGYVDIIFP